MRYVFLLAAILLAPSVSYAANIYEIKNVAVSQAATDQTKAREKAMAEAEKKSFAELQKKLVDGGFITQKQDIPAARISAAVDKVDIVEEKITPKNYKATYNFTYSSLEVSRIFGIRDIQPTVDPEKFLVIPIVSEKTSVKIWKNDWWKTWNGSKTNSVVLPLGDLQDVQNLKNEDLANNKYDGMFRIQKRYGATAVVLVQAEYVEAKNSLDVQLENIKGDNRTVINYEYPGGAGISKQDLFEAAANDISYRLENNKLTDESLTTSANPIDDQPLNHLPADPNPSQPDLNAYAQSPLKPTAAAPMRPVVTAPIAPGAADPTRPAPPAGFLDDRGAATNKLPPVASVTPPSAPDAPLAPLPIASVSADAQQAVAPLATHTDVVVTAPDLIAWNRIRNKIIATPGVTDLQIKSFAAGQASISLSANSDIASLKPALAVRGLDLIGDGKNWEIKEK